MKLIIARALFGRDVPGWPGETVRVPEQAGTVLANGLELSAPPDDI
jgi:hypothetical protein